jgi:hypothetical protein
MHFPVVLFIHSVCLLDRGIQTDEHGDVRPFPASVTKEGCENLPSTTPSMLLHNRDDTTLSTSWSGRWAWGEERGATTGDFVLDHVGLYVVEELGLDFF